MSEWTPRMQQLSEEICRYALETGEMPSWSELGRRMKLSITRISQLWAKIERWERRHLPQKVHDDRAKAGYLLAVLGDIEKAAKMAGRAYPWKRRWQGPPREPKPKYKRPHWRGERWGETRSWTEFAPPEPREPRFNYRPRFAGLIECPDCHGTGAIDGDWCLRCSGEATIVAQWG